VQDFPRLLARGPWSESEIEVDWSECEYSADAAMNSAADRALAQLGERGSPTHDGLAARLNSYEVRGQRLSLELEPMRWALRLVEDNAHNAFSALCVTRRADGHWLAGKRASWVASWAGRWTLGAGGSVEVSEHPMTTLTRELREEWSVEAQRITGEALIELPAGLVMFVGLAYLDNNAEIVRDAEHDDYAWWPPDISQWPEHAEPSLKKLARILSTSEGNIRAR
jgi:8-oxo-dGTP diphosphatase